MVRDPTNTLRYWGHNLYNQSFDLCYGMSISFYLLCKWGRKKRFGRIWFTILKFKVHTWLSQITEISKDIRLIKPVIMFEISIYSSVASNAIFRNYFLDYLQLLYQAGSKQNSQLFLWNPFSRARVKIKQGRKRP